MKEYFNTVIKPYLVNFLIEQNEKRKKRFNIESLKKIDISNSPNTYEDSKILLTEEYIENKLVDEKENKLKYSEIRDIDIFHKEVPKNVDDMFYIHPKNRFVSVVVSPFTFLWNLLILSKRTLIILLSSLIFMYILKTESYSYLLLLVFFTTVTLVLYKYIPYLNGVKNVTTYYIGFIHKNIENRFFPLYIIEEDETELTEQEILEKLEFIRLLIIRNMNNKNKATSNNINNTKKINTIGENEVINQSFNKSTTIDPKEVILKRVNFSRPKMTKKV